MKWIKKEILKGKVKRSSQKKKEKKNHFNINYAEAKKIGILFSIKELEDLTKLKIYQEKLKKENKEVSFITFFEKKKNPSIPFDCTILSYEDISLRGKIKSDNGKKIINTSFDYLLYIGNNISPIMAIILDQSNAKCRIGAFNEKFTHLFELMLIKEKDTPIESFLEQLTHYLTKIKNEEKY